MAEQTEVLDRTSKIAEEKLASMKKDDDAKQAAVDLKAKEEAEIAFSEKSPTEQKRITEQRETEEKAATEKKETAAKELKEKTEAEEKLKNQKPDEELLKAEDKDLNEEEIARKKVLVDKEEDAKSPEQKFQEAQDKIQKRFDDLTGRLKAAEDGRSQDSKEIADLKAELANTKSELENSGSIESEEAKDARGDEERYATMVQEDQNLPREERREMSKEDIEEFLLEDLDAATDWKAKRELRRYTEKQTRLDSKKSANHIDEQAKQFYTEYPDCDAGFKKVKELVDGGKTDKEATEIVVAENKDFALMMEIFAEDKKYSDPNNGPDLMLEEMQKRKAAKPKEEPKESYTKAEVDKMIEDKLQAEKERLERIDPALTNSISEQKIVEGSPLYKAQWEIWLKASKRPGAKGDWSKKEFERVLQYGKDNRRAEHEDALEE